MLQCSLRDDDLLAGHGALPPRAFLMAAPR